MSVAPEPYCFKAELHHLWDGDTIWLVVDRGEGWTSKGKYRLYGVDTPEIRGRDVTAQEKMYAQDSKMFLQELLVNKDLLIRTYKNRGKYDFLVSIWVDGVSVADQMILHGHGVAYHGGTKQDWDTRCALQELARTLL